MAKVRLTNGIEVIAYSRRGPTLSTARVRVDVVDLPGVRYHTVRGALDCVGVENAAVAVLNTESNVLRTLN